MKKKKPNFESEELYRRCTKLVEALQPFANYADKYKLSDDEDYARINILVKDLRKAQNVIKEVLE